MAKNTLLGLASKDPSYLVAEFLARIIEASAYRIRRSPTLLSSKVTNQAAEETLALLGEAGKAISYPEKGDPRWITYIAEELEAVAFEAFDITTNMEPEVQRFTKQDAEKYIGEGGGAGYYARLTMPGYMDSTDWRGPYRNENEALRELEEIDGPWELPPYTRAVIGWLRDVWISIYRQRSGGFYTPDKDNGRRLISRLMEFGTYLRFDRKFTRALIKDIPLSYSKYAVLVG